MKANIHPKWYPEAKIICACGNTFTAGSTKPEIRVEICYACHPFFTGKAKFIDAQGRVEKFQARQKAVAAKPYIKKKKQMEEEKEQPRTLKEMLHKK